MYRRKTTKDLQNREETKGQTGATDSDQQRTKGKVAMMLAQAQKYENMLN